MQIDDFYRQMHSINGLVAGNSKLILLGRPNAFTTNDEEIYVLRGMKRLADGNGYSFRPGAVKYRHYRIAPFTEAQTDEFVEKYLHARNMDGTSRLNDEEITARANEVKRLVKADAELFRKPVHVRIITDLARAPDYDLWNFEARASRWQLYDDFFESLLVREVEKDGRDRIRKSDRLVFLERLAQWLWRSRDGMTSFRFDDLPDSLLDGMSVITQGEIELRSLLRELLMGPIIERKSDDIFYFGHRSFAEYLIASTLYRRVPMASDHSFYSSMFRDGVETFLSERQEDEKLAEWLPTFWNSKASISFEYFQFLVGAGGGMDAVRAAVGKDSHLGKVFECFGENLEFTSEVVDALHKVLLHPNEERFVFANALLNLARIYGLYDDKTGARIIAGVLDRFLNGITIPERQTTGWAKPHYEDARLAAISLITEVHGGAFSRMDVDFQGFGGRLESLSQRYGFSFNWNGHSALSLFTGPPESFEYKVVLPLMKPENAEKLRIFSINEHHLGALFIKEVR